MRDRHHGLADLCYDAQPGTGLRCLKPVTHGGGDHYNWPTKTSWPNGASKLPPAVDGESQRAGSNPSVA